MVGTRNRICLLLAGTGAFLGGALHVAAWFSGLNWIAFLHAPEAVVASTREGT